MNVFNKRFFALMSLIFLGFTAISFETKNLIFFMIFALIVGVFFWILSKRRHKSRNLRLICILLICASALGMVSSRIQIFKNNAMIEKHSGEHKISGYIVEVSAARSFMGEYVMRVESLDGKREHFDVVLVCDYPSDLSRGDFLEFDGKISSLSEDQNVQYLKNKNAYDYPLICHIGEKDEIVYKESEFRVSLMLSGMNAKFSSTFMALLGKDGGSLASALLLGNRELLSDDTLRDFKRAGVYHMLALSGMHVAILIGVLDWLLKKIFMPRSVRIVTLSLLSLFYVALTGFALSACRSMLMLWVMYLSLVLGKKRDALTALFFAVFVIVLINPSAVLDVGLQLSFLSTFGVICASLISDKLRLFKKHINGHEIKARALYLLQKIIAISIASLCVFIVTLPVLMTYFGEVSLATFISNMFMGVVCEAFMIFSLLTLLFSWSVFLRFPFAEISVHLGNFMTKIVSYISDIEGVMLSLAYPCIKILVWGLFWGFLFLLIIRLGRKWMIFLPSVIFILLLCVDIVIYTAQRDDFVRVEYISSDSIVMSSSNEVYICDMSEGRYGDFYESVAIAKENCFTEIDGIILTHYHSNHIISLERLAKNYKIHSVLIPKPQNSEEDVIARSIVRVMESVGVEVYIFENEQPLEILDGELSISPRAYIVGYAHPSVALSFEYKELRVTLLGRPYFDTYLEQSGIYEEYIADSDYLILGADGKNVDNNFDIFSKLKDGCEIVFSDFELMNQSNFDDYIGVYDIYFDVEYKKYDLK